MIKESTTKSRVMFQDADDKLRERCLKRATDIYGFPLPYTVSSRLSCELNAINANNHSSQYLIGAMIADETSKKGATISTRGTISSAFVSYLCGISKVNPLPAHRYCTKCHYFETLKLEKGVMSYDLHDETCPHCGSTLNTDGLDIYPEINMGIKLDREPDIILNVPSEIRPNLIIFLKECFGENSLFRAGVKALCKDGSIRKNVHPGGIFILPEGEDITNYTTLRDEIPDDDFHMPVTETDYHDLYDKIKKYDLLTIPELSMLRVLETVTGYDSSYIKMNDNEVLEVFLREGFDYPIERNNKIAQEIQHTALKKINPRSFSDLVSISGLMRGVGTWENNGEVLIQEGKALYELITCRDDIMKYLINVGFDRKNAFDIMNRVRKGIKLTDEQENDMKDAGVPEWYIESCNKIKYLFPKSHIGEYTLLYWKLAYYRLHYPDIYEYSLLSKQMNNTNK